MEHGERIAEVNRLLTSGDKMSQKKIAALAEIDFKKNRHGPTGMLRVQWKAPYMRFCDFAEGY